MCRCPLHQDNKSSLTLWVDKQNNIAAHCFAGCPHTELLEHLGLPNVSGKRYVYCDKQGEVLYTKVRTEPKGFWIDYPADKEFREIPKVLYNNHLLAEAHIVWVVEGEKDADNLNSALESQYDLAVTNYEGAGRWRDEYAEALRGKTCIILADADEPGTTHAAQVYKSLINNGVNASYVGPDRMWAVVGEPSPSKGADVSDWLQHPNADISVLKQIALSTVDRAPQEPAREEREDELDVATSMRTALKRIESRVANPGCLLGISSGFSHLDEILDGLAPGRLIILAARPGMGKTALALNFVSHLLDAAARCLVVSLEMSKEELLERLVVMRAGVSLSDIRTGKAGEESLPPIRAEAERVAKSGLRIADVPSLSIEQCVRMAEAEHRKAPLSLLVVDYIQLLTGDNPTSREREVASFTLALKALAKRLAIPVLALSQLNRLCEMRQDRRPIISDLRESGAIEQDADQIMFLYRDEVYTKELCEVPGIAEVIVSKNRAGALSTALLRFDAALTKFSGMKARLKQEKQKQQEDDLI